MPNCVSDESFFFVCLFVNSSLVKFTLCKSKVKKVFYLRRDCPDLSINMKVMRWSRRTKSILIVIVLRPTFASFIISDYNKTAATAVAPAQKNYNNHIVTRNQLNHVFVAI